MRPLQEVRERTYAQLFNCCSFKITQKKFEDQTIGNHKTESSNIVCSLGLITDIKAHLLHNHKFSSNLF